MSVKSVCARKVDLAKPQDPVLLAARRMHDRKVGSLVVCDSENQPVGILTDRDLAIRVVGAGRDPHTTTVAEVMTEEPQRVGEDEPVEQALRIMRTAGCRRLAVVDRHGRLAGVVTLDDILRLFAEEFRDISTMLWDENPSSLAASP